MSGDIHVVAKPHLFRSDIYQAVAPEGMTLAEIVGTPEHVAIDIDGEYIPREKWSETTPKAGSIVVIRAVPAGGGGGNSGGGQNKDTLRIVALIAVAVAAPYAAGLIFGTTGLAYTATAIALTMAGNLAVNSLIPPQVQQGGASPVGGRYNRLTGAGNVGAPFEVIPRLYGQVRYYPPLAASYYSETAGGTDNYLRLMLCLGYGPLSIGGMVFGELVENGGGEFGDNSNFGAFSYDGTDGATTAGCFTSSGSADSLGSQYIPVNAAKKYKLAASYRCTSVNSGSLLGFACYNSNKDLIRPQDAHYISGTRVSYYQNYLAGAASIRVNKPSVAWEVSTFGHLVPGVQANGGNLPIPAIDIVAIDTISSGIYDTITLSSGIPFDVVANVDYVANSTSNTNAYSTALSSGQPISLANTWLTLSAEIGGTNSYLSKPAENHPEFLIGTAFVRIYIRPNTNGISPAPTWKYDNISLQLAAKEASGITAGTIKIGDTNLENFTDYEVEIGGGDQIKLYTKDVEEVSPGVQFTQKNVWESAIRTTATDTDEISVGITWPQGLHGNYGVAARNNLANRKISYSIAGANSWTTVVNGVVLGTDGYSENPGNGMWLNSAFTSSKRWTVPRNTYDVKVEVFVIGSATDGYLVSDSIWSALRSIKNTSPWTLRNTVVMAMRIKSSDQLSGQVGNISVLAQSVLNKQLYGSAGTYPLTFAGNPTAATSNPAAAFYNAAQGPQVSERSVKIDLKALQEWAEWCEVNGYTYNWVHDRGETVVDRLRAIASAGRASLAFRDGQLSVVQDTLQTNPVQMITPRNSWGFSSSKSFFNLPHGVKVKYIDPITWEPAERVVLDDGYRYSGVDAWGVANTILPIASTFESLETQGCTSATQAFKEGRFHLAQLRLRPETYTVTMDAENLVAQRGDVVLLAHDVILVGIKWGRIKSIVGAAVTLDEEVTQETGKSYVLRIRQQNNTYTLHNITTAAGTAPLVTCTASVTANVGDLVMFGESGLESIRAKILSIDYNADLSATLRLVDEAQGILTADLGIIPAFEPAITTPLELRVPPAPRVFSLSSSAKTLTESTSGSWLAGAMVVWSLASDSAKAIELVEVRWTQDAGVNYNYKRSANATDGDAANPSGSMLITGLAVGTVVASARARTITGVWTAWSATISTTVVTAADIVVDAPVIGTMDSGSTQLVIATDGTITSRIYVPITPAVDPYFKSLEVEFRKQGDTLYTPAFAGIDAAICSPVIDGQTYTIRVRTVNKFGTKSGWTQGNHGVVGKLAAPSPVTGLAAVGGALQVSLTVTAAQMPVDADLAAIKVYSSLTNDVTAADIIQTVPAVKGQQWGAAITTTTGATRYHWVKTVDTGLRLSSQYPASNTAGIAATPYSAAEITNSYMSTLSLVATGNCVIEGNQVYKNGGSTGWDSSVRSKESYTGGCYASWVVGTANSSLMVAVTTDPLASDSYEQLDYAIYQATDGNLYSYDNAVWAILSSAYSVGDVCAISYDGVNVKYYKNGVVLRTVAASANLALFLDSSFNQIGDRIKNLQFGPLSSQNWNNIGGLLRPQDNATATSAQNLVFNGAAEFGDNRNFTGFTYDATDGASGKGCFTTPSYDSPAGALIPVNIAQQYEISAAYKCSNVTSTQFLGYDCLDSNGVHIGTKDCFFYSGTRVAYYQAYSAGATVVRVLKPATAWRSSNTWMLPGVAADGSNLPINGINITAIDTTNGAYDTITLSSGIPANVTTADYVANSSDGGSYQYALRAGEAVTTANVWENRSAVINGVNGINEAPPYNKFRRGTAYVQFLFLSNYNSVGGTTWKYDDLAIRALGSLLPTVADGTSVYRTTGAPTNNPVPTGSVSTAQNSNGTVNLRVDWLAYVQGAAQADLLILFWRKDGSTPTINDSSVSFNVNTSGPSYYIFEGVNPADTWSFGIAAARRTEAGLVIGAIVAPASAPDWLGITGTTPNYTANVNGVGAATIANVATNFNGRNDRNSSAVAAPVIGDNSATFDHVLNNDGSADLSFEWTWGGTEADIDGFVVYVHDNGTTTPASRHVFSGSADASETLFSISAARRAFIMYGVAADHWYTIGVQAYRVVDPDVNASGVIKSGISQSIAAASETTQGAYRPSANASFAGNVTGTISGSTAATVVSNAANGDAAYSGTATYRDAGAPTNNPVPSTGGFTVNGNGSIDITVGWNAYTQGARQADALMLFFTSASSPPSPPTLSSPSVMFNVNTGGFATHTIHGVNPSHYYTLGIAAARRTINGMEIGPIILPTTSPDWSDLGGVTANFSGTINGQAASVVTGNADSGAAASSGTSNYRVNAEPANNPVFGTITKSATADGNSVVYVPYTYTQGSPIADQIFIFAREGGGTVVAADPAVATNAVSGEMKFTLKPSTTYTFGLQAVRRTESGFVGKAILTSPSIVTDAANFTGNLNGTIATTVVSNATNGNAAYSGTTSYRTTGSPGGAFTFGAITQVAASNGLINVTVPYSYASGPRTVDQFFVFVREGGGTVVASDPSFATNAADGSMTFSLKSNTTYTFGLSATRRTENGFESTAIQTSGSVATGIANFTDNISGTASATVLQGAGRANTAINASGNVIAKVIPTDMAGAAPATGAGLYVANDYMGYYNGSSWRAYIDGSGNAYFGDGASNYVRIQGAVGSIRGYSVVASNHLTVGSTLTSAALAADTTLYLADTTDFAASGSGFFFDNTNDRDAFSYAGKTSNSLTGCSGVLAHPVGAVCVPATKGMHIVSAANEMRFVGDRGDGTIEELASIGVNTISGGFFSVLKIGGVNASRVGVYAEASSSVAIKGVSNSNIGVFGESSSGAGVRGNSTSAEGLYGVSNTSHGVIGYAGGSLAAVKGRNTSGVGVEGESTNSTGGRFSGPTAPVLLVASTLSAAPTHDAGLGSLWVTSGGILYINTSGSITWQKVGAQ